VNRYSASASEIVAGAIQDYRRGIIVGYRTFGKGTVQSLENLSEGQIKITESKYYRVNGMSTQNKGIVPDIELPSTWDITTIGESSYPTALSWDVIKPIRHFKFIIDDEIFDQIAMQFKNRLIDEPNLNYLKKIRNRYDLNKNKKLLSLKIEDRELQKELRKNWLLKIENERRLAIGLDAFISYDELEEFNENENDINTNSINLKTDYQLIESTNIMNDYLNFRKKTILSFIQ
jgi:carboxyl-terminal processing protease